MEEKIKLILNEGSINTNERGQLLIRSLCRAVDSIVNYNYAETHYNGDDTSTVMKDKVSSIKNALAVVISDMELYMTALDIADITRVKAHNRICKMADRIMERKAEEEANGN